MPVISTNTAANTAVRFLNRNSSDQTNSLAKLASGSNINKASDDAAGLAISTKIGTDVAALEQASTNASHGISVLQTADGGASNIADIVERMKTLASQSASGTVTDTERAYVQAEFEQLQDEIDGITESTRYNGQSLLDGSSDFSVDDTTTAAVSGNQDVAAVQGGTTAYSSSVGADQNSVIAINGESFTLTAKTDGSDEELTMADAADQINAQVEALGADSAAASVYAYVDSTGALAITDNSGSNLTIDDTSGDFALTDIGLTDGTDQAATTVATSDYSAASATEAATGTISIDGTKVTLTTNWDSTNGATLTKEDMVSQINEGLKDAGNYQVEASLNSDDQIVLTSLDTGANASVSLADVDTSGGISLGTLGLSSGTTNGTTTEAATTGAEIVVGSTSADTINLSIDSLDTESLGIADLDVSTEEGAAEALSVLDMAIDKISDARAEIGATMSRFEFRSSQIDTSVENLEAAKSAIADVDIAKEQASLSSSSVKVQAAVAAASQANQMPQNLLSLIR
ncbi:flagellin [uncultured Cohaesibacter sp.]|uniref:flagellin N-terminal helical domain-containing protein n=1 Tax=uncultured Cohaesibacter sp. TaxID=1002546 RepID=UPI002AAA7AD8|nr:flagellin [uncultured Cohaesibacter sp.]